MANIVFIESRPFCYRDFLEFELNGREYSYVHGTIRNIFSQLRKDGKIEFVYQSTQAFYTLAGVKLEKPITPNHGEDYLTTSKKVSCNSSNIFQWINQVFMT